MDATNADLAKRASELQTSIDGNSGDIGVLRGDMTDAQSNITDLGRDRNAKVFIGLEIVTSSLSGISDVADICPSLANSHSNFAFNLYIRTRREYRSRTAWIFWTSEPKLCAPR